MFAGIGSNPLPKLDLTLRGAQNPVEEVLARTDDLPYILSKSGRLIMVCNLMRVEQYTVLDAYLFTGEQEVVLNPRF